MSAEGSVAGASENVGASALHRLLDEYKEETFGCAGGAVDDGVGGFLMPCDEIPRSEVELRFRQDPQVSFVVKAVSALTAAFRLAQLERCSSSTTSSCLGRVPDEDELHESILDNLRKLSFSPPAMMASDRSAATEVEGTQHHFTRNGRLVANRQQVYAVDRANGLDEVSVLSSAHDK